MVIGMDVLQMRASKCKKGECEKSFSGNGVAVFDVTFSRHFSGTNGNIKCYLF